MDKRLVLCAVATVLSVGQSRASAQEADISASQVTPVASGYQVDGSDGGFTLVTHGLWRLPDEAPSPVPALARPNQAGEPRHLSPAKAKHRAASLRRSAFLAHVTAAETRYGLPAGLLDALIWTESRYNPFAVSRAGATGLGQLMPSTARELGVANRFDASANLWAAARYLRQLLDKFGMVHLALAAYNAGPGAVERTGGIPVNGETPSYVRNVIAFWGAR